MKHLLAIFLMLTSNVLHAQTKTYENDSMILRVTGHDTTYIEKPFRSGNAEMAYLDDTDVYPGQSAFIIRNLKYPSDASEKEIEGTVWVRAYLDADGRVSEAVVSKGVYPSLDAEARRVVMLMRALQQDETKGKKASMWVQIKVPFKLNE